MAVNEQPPERILHALLVPELRKCKALQPFFVAYNGAEEGDPQRSLQAVYNAARKEVTRRQREMTRDGLLKPPAKVLVAVPRKDA